MTKIPQVRTKFSKFWTSSIIHTVSGLALARIIDRGSEEAQNYFQLKPMTAFILQLSLNIFVLYVFENVLHTSLDEEWQGTTPGLMFSATFFLAQTNLFENIDKINKKYFL